MITGLSRIATISTCGQRYPSVIHAVKNCDADATPQILGAARVTGGPVTAYLRSAESDRIRREGQRALHRAGHTGRRHGRPSFVVGAWGDGRFVLDFSNQAGRSTPRTAAGGQIYFDAKGNFLSASLPSQTGRGTTKANLLAAGSPLTTICPLAQAQPRPARAHGNHRADTRA